MSEVRLPLVLTSGDPAGIGPEISLRAWQMRSALQRPFCLLADPLHISRCAADLGLGVPIVSCDITEVQDIFATALPVIPLSETVRSDAGRPDARDGAMTIQAITRAVEYVHQGKAHGVVTNPIAKEYLYKAGFQYPGHTEYLGALAEQLWHTPAQAVMMLWSSELAVVPVTIHISLAQVIKNLSPELIISTARIIAHDMRHYFGIERPRIVCAGLNPHAGENGTMGHEDLAIIAPAIAQLQKEGLDIVGPLPADTLFHKAARARYDVALCMYHDQALIPLKTLAFDEGVNVTLGLPFIRTSPDHGTAFDIAGKGIARADSLMAALRLADRLHSPVKRAQV
jgi:4-hydroxythreonine-4-phosphate dehydrogenase